jgi:hypothetical protein
MRRSLALALACAVTGACLALALASCDGEIPAGPDAVLTDTGLDAKAYPATHSVTGQGTRWYERPGSEGWTVISLNARLMPDGTPKGNFHWLWRSRDPGGRIFVKVSCLTIVGNEAWMVGQASQAVNRDNIGKWMGLYVVDNGEGRNAPPDEIAHHWLGSQADVAGQFCTEASAEGIVTRAVTSGNIKIH